MEFQKHLARASLASVLSMNANQICEDGKQVGRSKGHSEKLKQCLFPIWATASFSRTDAFGAKGNPDVWYWGLTTLTCPFDLTVREQMQSS